MAGGLKENSEGAVITEMYDAAAGRWLAANEIPQTWSYWGLYPHMYLMQDNRLFYAGAHTFGNGTPRHRRVDLQLAHRPDCGRAGAPQQGPP